MDLREKLNRLAEDGKIRFDDPRIRLKTAEDEQRDLKEHLGLVLSRENEKYVISYTNNDIVNGLKQDLKDRVADAQNDYSSYYNSALVARELTEKGIDPDKFWNKIGECVNITFDEAKFRKILDDLSA